MANDFKYYGGDNQIARLPYKTIDALQQLGLYAIKENDDYNINLTSDMAKNDPDYVAKLSAFDDIECSDINTSSIRTYNLYLGPHRKSINDIMVKKIKVEKPLTQAGKFTNIETTELKIAFETGDTCILYDGLGNIVLVRDISISSSSGNILSVNGFIFAQGSSGSTTNIGQWYASNDGYWQAQETLKIQKQYFHMIKFTTVEGDTCYLNAKSGRSSVSNWVQVRIAITGGLSGASKWVGIYSCSGFNAGKVIVGCDLKNNIMYYADGTNATFTEPASDAIVDNVLDAE